MPTMSAVPALQDNYIWFIQNVDAHSVLIVDPGEAEPVFRALDNQELQPYAILVTHGCHDHVDGIRELQSAFSLPVFGPSKDTIPGLTHPVTDGDHLPLPDSFSPVQVWDIPGHTYGHIGFAIGSNFFCGDTLFGAGCGRLHGTPPQLLFHSLKKITRLPNETRLYCAHEYTLANLRFAHLVEPDNPKIVQRIEKTKRLQYEGRPSVPSTLAEELETNPFLRCDRPSIKKAVCIHFDTYADSELAVFTLLRQWKDQF